MRHFAKVCTAGCRVLCTVGCVFVSMALWAMAEEPNKPDAKPDVLSTQLVKAKANRSELEKALAGVPESERAGMQFLIENMPDADLQTLKADFLIENHKLAYEARKSFPWAKDVPEAIFLNNVLPYANVDEKRDPWRADLYKLAAPLVKDCKTASDVAQTLNKELFPLLKLKYAPQRRAPNLSPLESIRQGNASCTGLSIVLSDACRAVGVPTRLVGTPNWSDKRGNHTWIEIWDKKWRFTGACEPDPAGLDRGWFVGDAAKAQKDNPEHAIYATSFKKTGQHFPLVWARDKTTVPGENITERYAKEQTKDTFLLAIRVVNESKTRIARNVVVTGATSHEGTSRGESADLNDFLSFEVKPGTEYTITVGSKSQTITTGKAGESRIVEIMAKTMTSSDALAAFKSALAGKPKSLTDLKTRDFATIALTKADAAEARQLLWTAHAASIRNERAQEIADRILKEGALEMPFDMKTFGEKPKTGRSLYISLHGGGNAPKSINDQQWQNQKKLYTVDEGIYLAPRAPTNTWNLWHEAHIDRLFARLIEDLIVLEDVNPDRVYLLGYSAGGDGVYQLAPRMADHWAAAAMMAGHPNGVSPLALRNVPFALQVGANDSAYNRNTVGKEYGEKLDKLQKDDPNGYEHFVKIHEGMGHWMKLEDKAALPWMAKFTRNPVPDRVVWKQTGTVRDRSYWLAVPKPEAAMDSLVVADHKGQTIAISKAEKITTLLVRLDDRMADLDQSVTVTMNGKTLFSGPPSRTIGTMIATLAGRGDPKLIFDAEIAVSLAPAK